MEQPSNPPSPSPPKESLVQRYKFAWRLLLVANLALGAYIFGSARRKDTGIKEGKAKAQVPSTSPIEDSIQVLEKPLSPLPFVKPQAIPQDQQREIFQWILEEKRKIKPKNREEKKRIDDDKAILKSFIRSQSVPSL